MTILARGLFFCLFFRSTVLWASVQASDLPILRWGVDVESGAPYSFKDPTDPSRVIGFEADIVEAVAKELGMRVEVVQNNWEGLVEGLKRKDYDIVANGVEITPDREQVVSFSRPYYVTTETLTVRANNSTITKLEHTQGRRVGTLAASLAQRILNEQTFPMQIVTYSEEYHIYNDLAIGRIDAALLDAPIALYYAKPNPGLKNISVPIGRLEYGIVTRKNDRNLTVRVDQALAKLIADGTIRGILERWGLWNATVAESWGQSAIPILEPIHYQKYLESAYQAPGLRQRIDRYMSFLPLLAGGAWMTLKISMVAMILAMAIGLLVALARLYGGWLLSFLAMIFVEIFRGTPLLIQLFLIFYGLPHVGIQLDPFAAAVLGLGLNYAACEAENYRAGILSIPKSQIDASRALGMSWGQSLRHIVLPQAVRVVIPPVTNDFIALLKDSSLVSVITMVELTSIYGQLASTYFDYLGIGLLTAAVYFLIGLPFVRLSRYFEQQLNTHLKVRCPSPASQPRLSPMPARLLSVVGRR
jgi:polar amino acid transport system substrate-binding protein